MKGKKIKVGIRSPREGLDEFVRIGESMENGTYLESEEDNVLGLYFPNFEMIPKVLSPERLRLLQMITDERPNSITKLAELLKREQANVQRDVSYLASLGIIDLVKSKGPKNDIVEPQFNWSGFEIELSKKQVS